MHINTKVLDFAISKAKLISEDVKRYLTAEPDGMPFGVFFAEMSNDCATLAPPPVQEFFASNIAKVPFIAKLMLTDESHPMMSCEEHGNALPDVVFVISKGKIMHSVNIQPEMDVSKESIAKLAKAGGTTVFDAVVIQMHTLSGIVVAHMTYGNGEFGELVIHDPRDTAITDLTDSGIPPPDVTSPLPKPTIDPTANGSKPTLH